MKEELINLEADFANNNYYGTNVWTDEKYRVLSGSLPVLLSAPHAVNQFRGDDIREAEKFTGAIARYVSRTVGSFAIFQLFTHSDPNVDNADAYTLGVVNLINNYKIKLLIDLHSSTFKDDTDIDIVTNKRETLCGHDEIIDTLKAIALKHNLKIDENNTPNKNKQNEVIAVTSKTCLVPSLRMVINNKNLDVNRMSNKIEDICKFLEEFESSFTF